ALGSGRSEIRQRSAVRCSARLGHSHASAHGTHVSVHRGRFGGDGNRGASTDWGRRPGYQSASWQGDDHEELEQLGPAEVLFFPGRPRSVEADGAGEVKGRASDVSESSARSRSGIGLTLNRFLGEAWVNKRG